MFAGQILPVTLPGARHVQATRLPPANPSFLIHGDLKAALDQFVRGTQASDSATEDRYVLCH